MMKRIIYLIIPALAFILSCEDKNLYDVKFSYQGIIDKEYRFSVGRVIPVTIGQSVETDGDITRDGRFFFYSSNSAGGNFDIYLRSMTDITTVRLTSHPSKDITPVVSPDGKKLAFVSFRDDPEGDIFVMNIKSADLIKSQEKSISSLSSLDKEAKNISLERDPESGVIINIKDANPVWSPDGKDIVYSSSKGGTANLWIMKHDGSDKKRITEKGGQYPSFSADGSKIIFVSYRENQNGDLYILDIAGGEESRIVSDNNIKLYPSFMDEEKNIIYSSIESDTNGNGVLDLQDRSIIRYIDTKTRLSYPLTKRTDTSFKAKWLPVLSTRDYKGVIIYTDVTGENINLNIIPDSGIIPKKLNAKLQYEMCETYLTEYEDTEKYLLSLESVFNNYGGNSDNTSRAYVNRALQEAALYYKKNGETKETKRIISFIQKRTDGKDPYASFILDLVEKQSAVKGDPDIQGIYQKFGPDKSSRYFLPFALEDLSDIYFDRGDRGSSLKILNRIAADFSDYERITDIQTKISISGDDLRKTGLSESAVNILNKGNANQKISVIKNLVDPFSGGRFTSSEADNYLGRISQLKLRFKDDKRIMAVLTYISGLLHDSKGSADRSREELLQSITSSHPNDLTFYLSNIKLGEIERRQSRFAEAEKYFAAGINRYSRRFKTENFKERLIWLINYYEQSGERSELAKKYKDASDVYSRLIDLVTLMHNKRLYPEVYSEFAPKAHILYIDSYIEWKGNAALAELEKSYKDKLPVFRMDFNRAAIYGLGYIYTKKALHLNSLTDTEGRRNSLNDTYQAFKMADEQIDWALFIDDAFIDPYILKSWIYQFVDSERNTYGDEVKKYAGKFFPEHLWEENLVILEKALNANDEKISPENEGDIYLNMANNYFLLLNYPRALNSYKLAGKYKKKFGSEIENALFNFHLGYSFWQNGEIKAADNEIKKAYDIYRTLSLSGGSEKYKYQFLTLYKYFALFSRYENKYDDAIEWYKKILKFADDNKLEIDRARYFQEIAYCYMKSGRSGTAKYNLDRAAALLEKYPDDERKYYLKAKFFGLGPFALFNLGPDSAIIPVVIGDNKIFYPLDTDSKKLLNLSLYEELAASDGDFSTAIKHLQEKIKLLKKSSTSVALDARIRAINNLGYYSHISGRYEDSEKYFYEAGKLAEEKKNLDGTKASMMNLVNLYAVMIEENINNGTDWKKKISGLIGKIESYKKNYYKTRLDAETETLKQAAKAKKTAVTEEQTAEAAVKIEKETLSIYYSLDISAAILKYYLAEILYASDPFVVSKKSVSAEELYSVNRDVFKLYKEASGKFRSSISQADSSGRKELRAKLMLNAASCDERIGEIERAYVALIDAKNFSEQNGLSWIKINAYYKLGNFLYANGKEVEKSDYLSMAEKYFVSAINVIEEYPALYSSYPDRIKMIYRDYINFLIDRGSEKRGFELSERYAQIYRIISVNALSPVFSNEYDNEKYHEYTAELGKLASLRNNLSSALLGGVDPLSADVVILKKSLSQKEDNIRSLLKVISSANASIKPYIEMSAYKEPAINNEIFRFHDTDKGLFYWKLSKGKMTSGYVKDSFDEVMPGSSGSPVFVLLSDSVIDLISSGKLKSSADFIFVNTMDRIPSYMNDSNSAAGNIYSEVGGLSGISGDGIEVSDGKGAALSDYSVIIDKSGSDNEMTPEFLFSSHISPSCIIRAGVKSNYQSLTLLMESALYSGIKQLIVTSGNDSRTVASLVKKLYGKPETLTGTPFFTMGYINIFIDRSVHQSRETGDEAYSRFTGYMKTGAFQKASVYLARWNSFQKERRSLAYTGDLWLIELLSGRAESSMAVLNSYKASGDEDNNLIKLRRAYTFFSSGDLKNAEKELAGLSEAGSLTGDLKLFTALLKIVRDGDLSAADVLASAKKQEKTVLPLERYLLPAAQYMFISGDDRAVKLLSLIPEGAYLSEGEHLIRYIISGVKPPVGESIRFNRMASLRDIKDLSAQREDAQRLIRGVKGIDSLSFFPVLTVLISHEGGSNSDELIQFGNSINLKRIIAESGDLTSLILLKKSDNFFLSNEMYAERIPLLKDMLAIASKNSFGSIRKEVLLDTAMNYYLMENFQESYETALSTEELFMPEDKNYTDMQLLRMNLYIKSGKYKEAAIKGEILGKMETLSSDHKYMLNLQLALVELNRLRSLKKATPADAAEFEKLFSAALNLVKHNTELMNRRGYRGITANVFDEFVNYKMKTGQHTDAHYYNEVKKLLMASSKSGSNLFKHAGTIDMDAVQQLLPEDGVYVSIAKNMNDIFIWIADKKNKNAFVIEKAYPALTEVINSCSIASAAGKDLGAFSKDIAKNLGSLYPLIKNKKLIIISTDSSTEKIPFEIAGDGNMLSDKSVMLYLPSLLLASAGNPSIAGEVYLPESDNSAMAYLTGVAIRESGIRQIPKPVSGRGMAHLNSKIKYNQLSRDFTVNGKSLKQTAGGSAVISASSDEVKGAGSADLLLYSREFNLQAALLNGSLVQDTNSAMFIEEFYRNAGRGVSMKDSFASALNKVKGTNRYSHPANWSGYRLNIYNLNLMK
jgi:TolB protein